MIILDKVSPMMEQYLAIKAEHPDKIVFFQVGDFYEIFFEDAPVAAREMEIVLTTRDANKENPIPLAGVPIHAAEGYLNKLLAKGYKIVICDQVEEAALAKGLVRRAVTRILTPGTVTDPEMLEEGRNNYLAVLIGGAEGSFGLAAVDVSTGDFRITEWNGLGSWDNAADELRLLQPAECICAPVELVERVRLLMNQKNSRLVEAVEPPASPERVRAALTAQWGEERWEALALSRFPLAAAAAATALLYLTELHYTPESKLFHTLELYFPGAGMAVDSVTRRNLELTQTIRDGAKQGSLLGLLDRCMNAMGRRLIRRWIEQPLREAALIEERLEAVEELLKTPLRRRELRALLRQLIDLERFCSRLCYRRVTAREIVSLKNSLLLLEPLQAALSAFHSALLQGVRRLPDCAGLIALIQDALVDDPPQALREGGLFRPGYHPEVDRLSRLSREGRSRLLEFEQKERQRTGIKSLRVGYNRNFGYYIEVTRNNLELVPPEYFRRQTLVNAERFITDELREMEEQITGARDRLAELEYELFETLRGKVAAQAPLLQAAARELARLDCLQSLAEAAERHRYRRPHFAKDGSLRIVKGRHPVVEQLAGERFVPNDIFMDDRQFVLVITGPNMAGKSTYIRSVALICLMAQIGSFVPADEADLPILDRIFARVGASDDLSRGYSTFMVEMQETATILRDATARSLLVLDEIGRGTSTYDGMSIARSVLEYIGTAIGAKTLFSTHYHELTNLEGELPGVKNYTMAVKEKGKEVIFLRRVVPGRSDKSYGVNVARLAGLPPAVIVRAEAILAEMEVAASAVRERQLSLLPLVYFPTPDYNRQKELLAELRELDLNRFTPLEALQQLYRMQKKLDEDTTAGAENPGGEEAADGD